MEVVRGIEQAGREADAVRADLTQPDGHRILFSQIESVFAGRFAGRLDVLVNNAGVGRFASLTESTDEEFDEQCNLNVRAVFQLPREAARRMTKAGWGRLITQPGRRADGRDAKKPHQRRPFR